MVVVDVWMVVTVMEERGEEEEAKERTTEPWVYCSKKFPLMPEFHSLQWWRRGCCLVKVGRRWWWQREGGGV